MTGSLPVPATLRDTRDMLTSVLVDAPDFVGLNRVTRYEVTLDMAIGVLREAVSGFARRARRPHAVELYGQCLTQLDAIHRLYAERRTDEARQLVLAALATLKEAGTVRAAPKD